VDKRVKMVFAGLCLCVLMVGCAEDRDTMPVPDMQEMIGDGGIEDYKNGHGDSSDTTGRID
jgi:hypothetical protein